MAKEQMDGFKCIVNGREMKSHLQAMAAHHRGRAAFYEKEQEKFADAPERMATEDPVAQMRTAGKRHSAKAEVFAFYAEHTDVESDYVMAPRQLQALEFIGDTMGMY